MTLRTALASFFRRRGADAVPQHDTRSVAAVLAGASRSLSDQINRALGAESSPYDRGEVLVFAAWTTSYAIRSVTVNNASLCREEVLTLDAFHDGLLAWLEKDKPVSERAAAIDAWYLAFATRYPQYDSAISLDLARFTYFAQEQMFHNVVRTFLSFTLPRTSSTEWHPLVAMSIKTHPLILRKCLVDELRT